MLFAEGQFRKVKGYRDLPQLVVALKAAGPPGKLQPAVATRKVG